MEITVLIHIGAVLLLIFGQGLPLEIDFIFGDAHGLTGLLLRGIVIQLSEKCQCIFGWVFLHELLENSLFLCREVVPCGFQLLLAGCVDKGFDFFFHGASSFGSVSYTHLSTPRRKRMFTAS